MSDAIPASVRALMAFPWRDKTGSTQSVAESSDDRVSDPSYYRFNGSEVSPDEFTSLTFAEVQDLHRDGAFGTNGSTQEDRVLVVNEHATHSLEEFLSDVTRAWQRHQDRLAQYVIEYPKP